MANFWHRFYPSIFISAMGSKQKLISFLSFKAHISFTPLHFISLILRYWFLYEWWNYILFFFKEKDLNVRFDLICVFLSILILVLDELFMYMFPSHHFCSGWGNNKDFFCSWEAAAFINWHTEACTILLTFSCPLTFIVTFLLLAQLVQPHTHYVHTLHTALLFESNSTTLTTVSFT